MNKNNRSICMSIIICICLLSVMFLIYFACIMPDYLARYNKIQIIVTNVVNNTFYSFYTNSKFLCKYMINTNDKCDNFTRCPLSLIKNNTYDYYCDCDINKCSFYKFYNFYDSYQFYILVISSGLVLISVIVSLLNFIINKNQ